MHVFFSGIGGTAIGPLALIAHQAGYDVSGSDKQASNYLKYLKSKGLDNIHVGQTREAIQAVHDKNPIDWLVFSSAIEKENPDSPELVWSRDNNVKSSKRDELLNKIIEDSGQKLVAVAGTHGKTTTTAMIIWLFKQLGRPVSYSVGAKISFGEMGSFDKEAEYFVYECDEYDRNFLAFHPHLSAISGVAYDHHDVFSTENDYLQAFRDFLSQSSQRIIWRQDAHKLQTIVDDDTVILPPDAEGLSQIKLPGRVNRENGYLSVQAVKKLMGETEETLLETINQFPGVSRRFEQLAPGLYTDYAHTPEKIAGCLQLAWEISPQVVIIYEPLTNRRQHDIKESYRDMFSGVKKLYWVPSYLTREDPNQPVLTPKDLIQNMDNAEIAEPAGLNSTLKDKISQHLNNGDLVVALSGGGGGSLDEWLRANFNR